MDVGLGGGMIAVGGSGRARPRGEPEAGMIRVDRGVGDGGGGKDLIFLGLTCSNSKLGSGDVSIR